MTEMEDRLLKQNSLTPEQQKQHMAEQLWLLYYNQYLYDHGVITERAGTGRTVKKHGLCGAQQSPCVTNNGVPDFH